MSLSMPRNSFQAGDSRMMFSTCARWAHKGGKGVRRYDTVPLALALGITSVPEREWLISHELLEGINTEPKYISPLHGCPISLTKTNSLSTQSNPRRPAHQLFYKYFFQHKHNFLLLCLRQPLICHELLKWDAIPESQGSELLWGAEFVFMFATHWQNIVSSTSPRKIHTYAPAQGC